MKTYALNLADIAPGKNPAYSPNLHKWMTKYAHFFNEGTTPVTVWRVRPSAQVGAVTGTLYIGYVSPDGNDFIGSRLNGAMTMGRKETCWSHGSALALALEPIEDFWARYTSVGRCAIDPQHRVSFIGDRWNEVGDHRTCKWCGHEQWQTHWVEHVEVKKSAWVSRVEDTATC